MSAHELAVHNFSSDDEGGGPPRLSMAKERWNGATRTSSSDDDADFVPPLRELSGGEATYSRIIASSDSYSPGLTPPPHAPSGEFDASPLDTTSKHRTARLNEDELLTKRLHFFESLNSSSR